MVRLRKAYGILAALLLMAGALAPAEASKGAYSAGFTRWHAAQGGFAAWTLSGANVTGAGAVALDPAAASPGSDPYAAGAYYGGNYYNASSFVVGEALGPITPVAGGFREAIPSWNADTPPGTWVETELRANIGGRWTKWYSLGVWAADGSTVSRHSVRLQGDADGFVAVDTLVITAKKAPAEAYQARVRLFRAAGAAAVPSLRAFSVAHSGTPDKAGALAPGNPAHWGRSLAVPECSQMVYADGGEVWCSPTSTSMVLAYWGVSAASCEARVRDAVAGTFDWIYDGNGNWPFNAAYAATKSGGSGQIEAYVARFTSLAQAEEWIAAGVPVVISFAWGKGDLDGAAIPRSAGHLAVLVGFDAAGNPIVNDPAAAADADVQRTYDRTQLESLWLTHSGGTVYLIYPTGHTTPGL